MCPYQSDAHAWLSKNIGEGIHSTHIHVEKEFGINIVRTQCLFFASQRFGHFLNVWSTEIAQS
jgi:hypothetical protein